MDYDGSDPFLLDYLNDFWNDARQQEQLDIERSFDNDTDQGLCIHHRASVFESKNASSKEGSNFSRKCHDQFSKEVVNNNTTSTQSAVIPTQTLSTKMILNSLLSLIQLRSVEGWRAWWEEWLRKRGSLSRNQDDRMSFTASGLKMFLGDRAELFPLAVPLWQVCHKMHQLQTLLTRLRVQIRQSEFGRVTDENQPDIPRGLLESQCRERWVDIECRKSVVSAGQAIIEYVSFLAVAQQQKLRCSAYCPASEAQLLVDTYRELFERCGIREMLTTAIYVARMTCENPIPLVDRSDSLHHTEILDELVLLCENHMIKRSECSIESESRALGKYVEFSVTFSFLCMMLVPYISAILSVPFSSEAYTLPASLASLWFESQHQITSRFQHFVDQAAGIMHGTRSTAEKRTEMCKMSRLHNDMRTQVLRQMTICSLQRVQAKRHEYELAQLGSFRQGLLAQTDFETPSYYLTQSIDVSTEPGFRFEHVLVPQLLSRVVGFEKKRHGTVRSWLYARVLQPCLNILSDVQTRCFTDVVGVDYINYFMLNVNSVNSPPLAGLLTVEGGNVSHLSTPSLSPKFKRRRLKSVEKTNPSSAVRAEKVSSIFETLWPNRVHDHHHHLLLQRIHHHSSPFFRFFHVIEEVALFGSWGTRLDPLLISPTVYNKTKWYHAPQYPSRIVEMFDQACRPFEGVALSFRSPTASDTISSLQRHISDTMGQLVVSFYVPLCVVPVVGLEVETRFSRPFAFFFSLHVAQRTLQQRWKTASDSFRKSQDTSCASHSVEGSYLLLLRMLSYSIDNVIQFCMNSVIGLRQEFHDQVQESCRMSAHSADLGMRFNMTVNHLGELYEKLLENVVIITMSSITDRAVLQQMQTLIALAIEVCELSTGDLAWQTSSAPEAQGYTCTQDVIVHYQKQTRSTIESMIMNLSLLPNWSSTREGHYGRSKPLIDALTFNDFFRP